MGAIVDAAASVTPPDQNYNRASVTTEEALKITDIARNAYISVHCQTVGSHVRVVGLAKGASAPSISLTNVSTVTSDVPAVATNAGWPIAADTTEHFDCRQIPEHQDIWLVHLSSATTGYVRFRRSSGSA